MIKTIYGETSQDVVQYRQGSGLSTEIFNIVVSSERGVGKGRRLVEQVKEDVKEQSKLLYAITRVSNRIALQFYKGIGFRVIARLNEFYRDTNEDGIMLGIDL